MHDVTRRSILGIVPTPLFWAWDKWTHVKRILHDRWEEKSHAPWSSVHLGNRSNDAGGSVKIRRFSSEGERSRSCRGSYLSVMKRLRTVKEVICPPEVLVKKDWTLFRTGRCKRQRKWSSSSARFGATNLVKNTAPLVDWKLNLTDLA